MNYRKGIKIEQLIETIVDYLFDQHSPELISIIAFLHNQLD